MIRDGYWQMDKMVVIINGKGGVGKDTLCGFAGEKFDVMNISSITPIKDIARQYGWNGEKDPRSRKFLAALKQAFVDYDDLPYKYLVQEYEKFLQGSAQILFAHIRERVEIEKFKEYIGIPCITLLIRRSSVGKDWGNASDDHVEDYDYDYIFDNDRTLEEAKRDFWAFIADINAKILSKS